MKINNFITPEITLAILNNVVDGIITIDSKGIVKAYNQAAENIFGYSMEEVIGNNISMLMDNNHGKKHDQYINNYIESRDAKIIGKGRKVTAKHKDGSVIEIDLTISEVKPEGSNETLYVGITRDVTDSETAERQTEKTNLVLNAISEAQSKYIQNADHKSVFNELLRTILDITESEFGFIGRLDMKPDGTPFLKTFAITNIAWNEDTRNFYEANKPQGLEFHNFETLFGYTLKTGKHLLTNSPASHPQASGIPEGHPQLNSYLGIPINQGATTVGMIGIANRPQGYDESIIKLLKPAITTSNSLFHGIAQTAAQAKSKLDIERANQQLAHTVNELQQKSDEITQIRELDDYLQICRSREEAFSVTRHTMHSLFPDSHGQIYSYNNSNTALLLMEFWGNKPGIEPVVNTDDCISARRGRTHISGNSHSPLQCNHIKDHEHSSVCISIHAQGETFGILSLTCSEKGISRHKLNNTIEISESIARQLGMALANLKLRDSLKEQSIRDPLTGLYNRRFIDASLEREIFRCERTSSQLAVLMFDADHFKKVNDQHGHDTGDQLLVKIANILKKNSRKSDIASRYGGEEFILVLTDISREKALERADFILDEVRKLVLHKNGKLIDKHSLSCGAAIYPTHGANSEDLLSAADEALYKSKANGRDQTTVATPSQHIKSA